MNKKIKFLTTMTSVLITGIGVSSYFIIKNNNNLNSSLVFLNSKKNDDSTDSTDTSSSDNIVNNWDNTYYLIYPTDDNSSYNLVDNVPDNGNFYTFDIKISLDLSKSIVIEINDNEDQIDQQTFDTNIEDNINTINNLFQNSINSVLSSNSFSSNPEMQGFKISNFNLNPTINIPDGDKAAYMTTSSLSYNVSGYLDDLNNEKEKNNNLNKNNINQLQQINTLNNTQIGLIVVIVLFLLIIAILVFLMIRNKRRMKD